jgi:type IV pilus assembly protein PilY1
MTLNFKSLNFKLLQKKQLFKNNLINTFAALAILIMPSAVNAATVNIATAPLVTASASTVLPNLIYILDNSGSMASDFMPDYVTDSNKCKSASSTSGQFSANCAFGDPPRNTKEFNTLYYNPAIRYSPGLNSLGAELPSMNGAIGAITTTATNGWTQVPVDAYGKYLKDQLGNNIASNRISLVPIANDNLTGYPDRVWCNKTGATLADLNDPLVCKKNSQYIYPNNTGTQATSFNQAYTLRGYPYYYNVAPGEYCSDKELKNCKIQSAQSAGFTFPATLRWCDSSARTNCQAKYLDSGFTFAKWSGISNGSSSQGKIKINADTVDCAPATAGLPICNPSGLSPNFISVTDVRVDGVSIIASPAPSLNIDDTNNGTKRSNLANAIRDAINNFVPGVGDDFTATASGDEVTISRVGSGAFNGTITVLASSVTRPLVSGIAAVAAQGNFQLTGNTDLSGSPARAEVSALTIGGVNIIGSAVSVTGPTGNTTANRNARRAALANAIVSAINSRVSSPDYTAVSNGATDPVITITAVTPGVNTLQISGSKSNGVSWNLNRNMGGGVNATAPISAKTYTLASPTTLTLTQFSGGTNVVNTFSRVDITPTTLNYDKAPKTADSDGRTDCVGSTCTYDEEMTNFANWYSYYRTRMQMMKTSTSIAFKLIDTRYRVGFVTINDMSTNYLPVKKFDGAQKLAWYQKLQDTTGNSSTPLRAALSTVGRVFAGKEYLGKGATSDPMQYSCQQNYSILTTDGYWNGGGGLELDGTTAIDNEDGTGTPPPMFEGNEASNTLADTAKYYFDTDLRPGTPGSPGCLVGGVDVCEDNVLVSATDNNRQQHMTTFTLGLGVDGELDYTPDYQTAQAGNDFYEIKNNAKKWPVPVANNQTAVDDLWHAAVNGQGTYFSAKDPNQLNKSLSDALKSIGGKVGAGAAAATSTLNPVAGDNFAYVASYVTGKWTGNLEARTIDTVTGEVSEQATWCIEDVTVGKCGSDGTILSETSPITFSKQTYCQTPTSTGISCSAAQKVTISSVEYCKVEISADCDGAMTKATRQSNSTELAAAKVKPLADNRRILIKNGATNNLTSFTYANLTSAQQTRFNTTWLQSNLSQWSALTVTQQALVTGDNLVNYIRGQTGFEDTLSNLDDSADPDIDNRLFRAREATMGDALESTPIFVGPSKLGYTDPNYGPAALSGTHKNNTLARAGTVYIGTNDGMMHAFNSVNGDERWAYIPSMVIPELYRLADKNYASQHANYVNGDAVVGDICYSNCTSATAAVWKTILVGGLNGGGSGYYALDITDPDSPSLLWEFTPTNDSDLGITFGNPVITKRADGKWVVVFTSGYNNLGGSAFTKGKGFLYVVEANTGTLVSSTAAGEGKYTTGVGDATTPSGLAKISSFVNDPDKNNTASYIYGGDLLGNLWRFDISAPAVTGTNPFKVAVLKDASNKVQPITVAPELSKVSGKRIIFVGTGKYLETSDLIDNSVQTLYAITDDGPILDNPRLSTATMVEQTLVTTGATRKITPGRLVNYAIGDRGWYIDLPAGERQNVPAQLVFGTLLLPTIVPSATVCSPGGEGWLNFVDFRQGTAVIAGGYSGSLNNAPIVGINVLYVQGKPKVSVVTADTPTPEFPRVQPSFATNAANFSNRRVIWRELIDEQ